MSAPPGPPVARHPLVERLDYYLARARAWRRRATASGLSIRVGLWLTGGCALVLALPPAVAVPAVPAALLVALVPAAAPNGVWPGLLAAAAVGAVTLVTATELPAPSLPRLLVLAALLYLHHTTAALAAQLRTDAVIPANVLNRWAIRAGAVLVASAVVSLGLVSLAGRAPGWSSTGYVVLGVFATLALAGSLLWSAHRRRTATP